MWYKNYEVYAWNINKFSNNILYGINFRDADTIKQAIS